jgi:CxxC motif-containing protein (DUF1111 family)
VESSAEGLGPLFNAGSCAQCHNLPLPGGAGLMRVMRAECPDQDPAHNSLVHLFSTRPDIASARVPNDCSAVVVQRRTTTLLGAGLVEAIPDAQIEQLAKQQPSVVAGRPAYIIDIASGAERVGHFGWKAQHATLQSFAGDAYRNEMGITNSLFPTEVAPNGDAASLAVMDSTPDPEATEGSLERLADFMRMLAPPVRQVQDDLTQGESLFATTGCETCHYAAYTTSSADPVLDRRAVKLYSDLLLHNVGTGDGIAQADAAPDELRTPPLWGVRYAQLWLHDGRASSLDEAIRMHAGQALPASRAYALLPPEERDALISFVRSL